MISRTRESAMKQVSGLAAGLSYVTFMYDPVGAMCLVYKRWGLIYALRNFLPFSKPGRLRVLALGPECNRQVLGNPDVFHSIPLSIPGPRDSAQRRISKGLTALNGEVHQLERRLAIPLFHKRAVEDYSRSMVRIADEILNTWQIGQCVDMWLLVRELPLRISSGILFGQEGAQQAYEMGQLINSWVSQNFSVLARLFPCNVPGLPYRRMLKSAALMEDQMLIRVKARQSTSVGSADILALLLDAHGEHDDPMLLPHLISQAVTLFGASYETTVNALTWTLFLLAQHPHVMHDVLDELDATLQGAPPVSDQLDRLPYLEAVIKESMRILPPVPYTIRVAREPVELNGLPLKKGDRVILSHYVTHHMPELYAEPEKFRPQRWFEISPSQFEYLPFSAGPRICIGYSFAMAVMKISLSMILQRFRLTVVPGSRIDRLVQVTMRPKFGIPMTIHHQDRQFRSVAVRGNIHEMVKLV